jgi:hypothetical protein
MINLTIKKIDDEYFMKINDITILDGELIDSDIDHITSNYSIEMIMVLNNVIRTSYNEYKGLKLYDKVSKMVDNKISKLLDE